MFGLFTRTARWGIPELKNELRQHLGLTTQFNEQTREAILNGHVTSILEIVFSDNRGTFSEVEKGTLKKMFDSRSSPTDIEAYLRAKLGRGYDKKVKRALAHYYKYDEVLRPRELINQFDKEFSHIFKKDDMKQ